MKGFKKAAAEIALAGALACAIGVYKRVKDNNPDGIPEDADRLLEVKKAGVELCIDMVDTVTQNAPEIKEVSLGIFGNIKAFVEGTVTLLSIKIRDFREAHLNDSAEDQEA